MDKKLFLIFAMAFLFVGLVSAGVEFVEDDGEYGKYVIDTWVPDWLGGKGTSEIKLIQNTDQCLIDCSFTLEGTNEQPVNLIDDIKFVNKEGKDVKDNLKEITFYLGKYEEVEKINYSKPIYSTEEVCTEPNLNETNSSNFTQSCYYPVVDYETYNVDELVWTEYNGEKVGGYFQLKAEAKKEKISMDWIITFRGKKLAEWEWWDSDWSYKRQINLTADVGKISYLSEINYSEGMQEDYDDLRFINNAEDTEFNYTIETYNSTRAVVRIYSQGETSFYMYYGNSEASSTSQTAGVFHFNPIAGYYMDGNANDFMNNYNGTVSGASLTNGKIGQGYNFDGVNDYIQIDYNTGIQNTFSFSVWVKPTNALSSIPSESKTGVGALGLNWTLYPIQAAGDTPLGNGYAGSGLAVGTNGIVVAQHTAGILSSLASYSTTLSSSEWNLVTIVFNNKQPKIYLNGELVHTGLTADLTLILPVTIGSGYSLGSSNNHFKGSLDEILKYNRALTSTEISALYNYTAPTYTIGGEQIEKGFITIDYITPPTPENNSNLSVNYIPVEVEINYTNATLDNITYDFYKGGELNQSYFFTNETLFVNHTGCQCDNWAFNVTACYTEQLSGTSNCTTTKTRYLIIDSKPPVINITSPLTTYDYLYDNYTLDLNWSVEDKAGHLDSCWYEYNGVNNSVTCNDNTTTFNYSVNVNNLTFYVNDTFGNLGSELRSWNYKILAEEFYYSNDVYETDDQTIKIKLKSDINLNNVLLYYNGVQYPTIKSENNYSTSLSVPSLASADFYWRFLYNNTYIYSENLTQTINPIFFGLCNATYNVPALNITVKNGADFERLNSSLEFSGEYYLGSGTSKKELLYKNTDNNLSNFQFCISPTNRTYNFQDIISYYAPDYERREYFLEDAELSNVTQQLSLYLLPTNTTAVFTLRVIDEDENNIEGAFVRVQRWDIGTNNFYTVGMVKTTSDGTGIINLRLNDAWYRYQVIYNGVLLKTTEPTKEASSERVIQVSLTTENPYNQFNNIDYELTYNNETNVTSLIYGDTTGSVQTGCLKVIKTSGLTNTEVHYSCVQSTSGTLSYLIEDNGNYIIRAIFVLTEEYNSVEKVIDEIIRQGTEERFQTIGKAGAFASLLLIGTAGLIGVSMGSIPLGLGLITASLILVNLIGWLNLSLSVIIGLVSIGILIIFNLGRSKE